MQSLLINPLIENECGFNLKFLIVLPHIYIPKYHHYFSRPTTASKSTEEVTSTSAAADIGKGPEQPMATSPNILSMDDIDKALGISSLDMQLMDIPGTSL